jgi:hypothetical protein
MVGTDMLTHCLDNNQGQDKMLKIARLRLAAITYRAAIAAKNVM